MKGVLKCINIVVLAVLLGLSGACGRYSGGAEQSVAIDSICSGISSARYSSVMLLDSLSRRLLSVSDGDKELQSVASNAKAYSLMMKMDYAGSYEMYETVYEESDCGIERLVAAVGLMTIDYRVSANRRFFDNRAKALELIERINEDADYLSDSDRERYERARIEFCIVSICYFANLGMLSEKERVLKYLESDMEEVESTPLRIYGRMIVANNNSDPKERLSSLLLGLNVVKNYDLKWLQANYKLLLAITLRDSVQRSILVNELNDRFEMFPLHTLPLDDIPQALSYEAKRDFEEFGDTYMMIEAMVVASSCKTQSGAYEEAILLLDSALAEVNGYYSTYYPDLDALRANSLLEYDESSDFVTDAENEMYNIPECLLSVRREASTAYAGMRDKIASDINREAYLELLRTTRMNKQLESRTHAAEAEAAHMRLWVWVLLSVLLAVIVLVALLRRWRVRYERTYSVDRKRLQEVSRKLMSSLPHEAVEKELLCSSVKEILDASLGDFSGATSFEIVENNGDVSCENAYFLDVNYMNIPSNDRLKVTTSLPLSKERLSLLEMVVPYVAVAIEEGMRIAGISEEHEKVEEQRRAYALYLAEHKRENLQKRVSLSVVGAMRPYMDRLIKELTALSGSLSPEDEERKLRYIDELTGKLDDLNVILERWIKMRHGELNLHIENFAVSDLFAIIEKSRQLLEVRGVSLRIAAEDEVVKADKALTLFMLNTLVDNAFKFTPAGGVITVGCESGGNYVELYVSDTGIGLSQTDIDCILHKKVYNASHIGRDNGLLQPKSKGGGFGLMNCKGIIEKYRKTDEVFSVCSLDITSCQGRGSRFSFRLPKGVLRCIAVLMMLLPSCLYADDALFERLAESVDSVYMSNVNGNHEEAFLQAQAAIGLLNDYYHACIGGDDTLEMYSGNAAELKWWREELFGEGLKEDIFFNILDVRNELAVASLALQRWHSYRYNNYIYSTLYRLVHEDAGIAERYEIMQQNVDLWQVAIALLSFLLVLLLVYLLLYYVRFNVIEKMSESMVADVNKRLLAVATGDERVSLQDLAGNLLHEFYLCVGENMRMERCALLLRDSSFLQVIAEEPYGSLHGRADIYMNSVLEGGEEYISADGLIRVMPLCAVQSGEPYVVGVLEVITERPLGENEVVSLEFVADYLASVAYHAVVRVESRYVALEELEEETERVKFEENRLHVKNLVMDNCLSVIKHETIYYPSRVRELAAAAMSDNSNRASSIENMRELMGYYSSIFGVLSNCAMRELNDMSFSIERVELRALFEDAVRYVSRQSRKNGYDISLRYETNELYVGVDKDMAACLFESLLDAVVGNGKAGTLLLRASDKGDTVCIELVDNRTVLSSEEIADLFVPTRRNITASGVAGMEFLVAKEIVRLHEDFTGKYGGRMEARSDVAGTIILFTLPKL